MSGETPAWKRHAAQVADDIVYAPDKYRETEGINDRLLLILPMRRYNNSSKMIMIRLKSLGPTKIQC